MAGLGHKTFVAGNAFTAADANGYLMDQVVAFFTSASARDTAITTPSTGMVCHIDDGTHWLCYYDGTGWRRIDLEWRSYTPAWTASTTNPSGWLSLNGYFRQDYDRWHVRIEIDTDVTITRGSGGYFLGVPSGVGFPTLTQRNVTGTGMLDYGSGATVTHPVFVEYATSTTVRVLCFDTNSAATISAIIQYWTDNTPSSLSAADIVLDFTVRA